MPTTDISSPPMVPVASGNQKAFFAGAYQERDEVSIFIIYIKILYYKIMNKDEVLCSLFLFPYRFNFMRNEFFETKIVIGETINN